MIRALYVTMSVIRDSAPRYERGLLDAEIERIVDLAASKGVKLPEIRPSTTCPTLPPSPSSTSPTSDPSCTESPESTSEDDADCGVEDGDEED